MSTYAVGQAALVDSNVRLRATLGALLHAAPGVLQTRGGMLDGGGAAARAGGMAVSVQPFRAFLQGPAASQFGYVIVNDAAVNLTVADGSAAARTDLICARVRDNPFDASGQVDATLVVVQGASGGGVPATPAGHLKLWEQPVAAGVSAGSGGLTADPADRRPSRAVAAGGVVPVADTAERNALLLYPGLTVYNRTSKALETYDGTAWSDVMAAWAPTWSAPTTNTVLGNGTLTGAYKVAGGWCRARLALTAGSTTTFGSGAFRFTLPVDAPAIAGDTIGNARLRDVSAVTAFARSVYAETSTTVLIDGPAGQADRVSGTQPFPWAIGDVLTAVLHYPTGP